MRKGWRWLRLAWGAVLLLAALGVVVLSVVLHIIYGDGTLERISTDSMDVHADFDTFWRSADAALAGEGIYDAGARLVNLNPPFWTLMILPFGLMEPLNAYRLFVLITLIMSVGSLAWMAGELRLRAGWAVAGAAMVLFSSPLLATFALGQMYPVLALGLVAAWATDRRGRYVLSGVTLGLVMALKPSLAPLILWPAVRKRWEALGAAILSGAAATLAGSLALGSDATLRYAMIVLDTELDGYWDNASLPAAATRTFTENDFADPLAALPWMVPAAFILGVALIIFTAVKIRHGSEGGLWALVAVSLLASPIAWHNYLLLLAPGVLLLLARGRISLSLLLLALGLIPPQWPLIWGSVQNETVVTLALGLYTYILILYWISFITVGKEPKRAPKTTFAEAAEPG